MGRRGHGEGSIYQRKKDGRWVAAIMLENHKRKYIYGDTRREVQEALKKALHEQQQGTLSTGPEQTLKVYLERWLEQVCKLTMRPNTYNQYRSIVRRHLVPALGSIKLEKLTPERIQSFCAQKQDEGLSAKTVVIIHGVLSSALDNAFKWGLIPRNVARLVSLPRIERYEAQTLTVGQALKLLGVARGSRIEALLLVALTTGMRRGELLALRWEDIDLEASILHVRRTVNPITGLGYKEGEPKSKAGRRKIVLSEVTIEALKEHRQGQEQVRARVGARWQEHGIVFCNKYGGFFNPTTVLNAFKKLLRDAGLPDIRIHDLRHSAATILAAARVDLKTIQERLGHSSIAITADIYSHVSADMQQEAAGKIDSLFRRS